MKKFGFLLNESLFTFRFQLLLLACASCMVSVSASNLRDSLQVLSEIYEPLDSISFAASLADDVSNGESFFNDVLPRSPQAAAMARYAEYPVSHTTGVPDISIPIYEIELGGFVLPVSISYHASGCRVDEVPTCVGLGWCLNAGGAVTRTILGGPDLEYATIDNTNFKLRDYSYMRSAMNYADPDESVASPVLTGHPEHDTESDRYTVNAGGHNLTFRYSHNDREFVVLNHESCNIQCHGSQLSSGFYVSFPDGTEWTFDEHERSGVDSRGEGMPFVTAWYVTEINTQWGKITFTYRQGERIDFRRYDTVVTAGPRVEADYLGYPVDVTKVDVDQSPYTYSSGQTLVETISWNGNTIYFDYSSPYPGKTTDRLERIRVVSSAGETVRTINFGNDSYWASIGSALPENGRRLLMSLEDSQTGTYFVYNDLGQLRYVLSPGYELSGYKEKFAYEYRYDEHGNVVKKFIPGGGYTRYWYDRAGRMTFMQDENLRAQNLHRFFIYDRAGRPAIQGTAAVCNRSSTVNFADYTGGTSGFQSTGYTLQDATRIQQVTLETVNYYDDYSFASALDSRLVQTAAVSAKGLGTGSVTYNSEGGKSMSAIYYDIRGNVTTLREITDFGTLRVTDNTYTFTNQPLTSKMTESGGVTMLTENTYDTGSGLLVSTDVTINGTKQRVSKVTYDDLGRITTVVRGNGANSGGTVSYSCNLHGQTTSITGPGFTQRLHYTDGPGKPLYNGSISSMLWTMGGDATQRGYKYTYNGYNWLTLAEYGEGATLTTHKDRYTERFSSFMLNGGIRRLQRHGLKADGNYGKIDNLHISYDGNRITTVLEDADPVTQAGSMDYPGKKQEMAFEYNAWGALIKDESRGIESIEYDNFGNPVHIDMKGRDYTKNVYSATGVKLKTEHYTDPFIVGPPAIGGTQQSDAEPMDMEAVAGVIDPGVSLLAGQEKIEYRGPVIYRNGKIDMVQFPGGYATISGTTVTFHYYTQDYLGNNRAVVNGTTGAIEQTTAYYTYGAVITDLGTGNTGQPFKFGGKELISANGLNMYDFGARLHYPAIPHFTSIDPLSEKYAWLSPYLYCANNPVNFVDLDGREVNLWATTLQDTENWVKRFFFLATHTFITVTDKDNKTHYYAYGSERNGITGAVSGKLVRKKFNQDKQVYSGKNSKDLKLKITIDPPEGMSQDDFDEAVIKVAESFVEHDDITYSITAISQTVGNCNSSTSTILYKAGVSKQKIGEIESQIPDINWGFGLIKPWTVEEQTEAINQEMKQYDTLQNSLH